MAILTSIELQTIRQGCAQTQTVNYDKPTINAAAQAVEDWLTSKAAEVSGVINTATVPVTLTVSQKKALFAWVVEMKFLRDR